MAAAMPKRPPRSLSRTATVDHDQEQSTLLDRLMSMGFPQNRSEKAIATTGSLNEGNIGDCVNWLLAHVDDPSLDDDNTREYILYMCPASGPLCENLEKFWADTELSAPNGAHESFPHIRLTTFFKVKDGMMSKLIHTIETTLLSSEFVQSNYDLEYQSLTDAAYKYVGLFLSDEDDDKLHDLAEEFTSNALNIGVLIEPYTRHMHMSLAYRFSDEHQAKIEELAGKIDTHGKCQWELRIYSRDIRISSHELREVTHEYQQQQGDEVGLDVGDIILTVPDSITDSIDGWFSGFSLKNGLIGTFPGNYTSKTPLEHKTWTLVKSLPMRSKSQLEKVQVCLYENVPEKCDGSSDCGDSNCTSHEAQELSLLFVRHAERVDAVMGKEWVKNCFEDSGGGKKFLKRFNLNMPDRYVKRRSIMDFERDPPITEIGRLQAKLIGKALASSPLNIKAVYSSPSLRCVETADIIVKRLDAETRPLIKIENCLFEWNRWHSILPTFIPPSDLKEQGFEIETNYKSEMLAFDLMESLECYYERSLNFCQNVIEKHNRGGGCVLMLGHAATPEVCIRKLAKKPALPQREFVAFVNKVPFCEPIMASRIDSTWTALTPPIPKLWHLDNKKFDMKLMTNLSL